MNNKEKKMNKLSKIGVSALCGSLAAVSAANAGEMTVKGGATITWTSLGYGVSGNPMGMATNLTFSGSGELDNGSAVAINIAHDDKNTYSASDISVDVPGMGSKQLVFHTSHLEDKHTAVNMLYQYVSDLKEAFLPYAAQAAAVLLPPAVYARLGRNRARAGRTARGVELSRCLHLGGLVLPLHGA